MDPSKIALGSPLHRLLRWTPGYVPTWVCSRNNCTGFDFLIAVEVCPVLGAVLLGKFYGHWWLLGVIIPLVFAFGVCSTFRSWCRNSEPALAVGVANAFGVGKPVSMRTIAASPVALSAKQANLGS